MTGETALGKLLAQLPGNPGAPDRVVVGTVAAILPGRHLLVDLGDAQKPIATNGTGQAVTVQSRQGQALVQQHGCPGVRSAVPTEPLRQQDVGAGRLLLDEEGDGDLWPILLE